LARRSLRGAGTRRADELYTHRSRSCGAANTSEPLQIDLEELSAGGSFTTLRLAPHVRQAGKLCASGIMLLDVTAPDAIRHAAALPEIAGPYDSPAHDMSVTGRDVRFVDGA
jgi:acyl-CoA thioesterase II